MRSHIVLPLLVLSVVLVVECSHMFTGTSVFRQEVYHREVNYYRSRGYEYFNYTIPAMYGYGRTIQLFVKHYFGYPLVIGNMRFLFVLPLLVIAVVIVECSHTFLGTSVFRQEVFHREIKYGGNTFSKRIEFFNYTIPANFGYGRTIQGILAYDLTRSPTTSANVTAGGLGYPFVSLRMKSDRRKDIRYDVYIYA